MIIIKSDVLRLFVAVNFNNQIIDALCRASGDLKKKAGSGNFTKKENFHLTLAFIGETDRLSDVKRTLDGISFSPFEITLGKPGVFRRPGGDIYFVSALSDGLEGLANKVSEDLRESGFDIEKRKFVPHITLARQVVGSGDITFEVSPAVMAVNRISLMKSERINGVLKYTEVYLKEAVR
ncbi:MAG: RNA 2',3'-cyclic phosphodiesterase [Clostridiales bacterium]|nr:RNA 2',3'-cyclic phosphodiesterase [Clostridiales bacterium]